MRIPLELIEQFAKGNGVAFVGMDLSVDAGLPSRDQLQALLCRELDSIPNTLSFFDTAQCYVNEYGRLRLVSRLREIFDTQLVQPTPTYLAIARLPITYIFTTNYDSLLEEALTTLKKPYDLLINNSHFGFWNKERLQLIKLHGDLRQPDSTVVTAQDYEEYFNKHAALTRTLGVALQSSTVLFLGYSGLEDPNFRQLLTQVRNESGDLARNAFTVLFNAKRWVIDELKRRGLRVINLEVDTTQDNHQARENRSRQLRIWLDELNQQVQTYLQASTPKTKSAASPERELPSEPYKFLDFFTSSDSEIFHGRRQETEWLIGLILSSRLTILYGESGTGKTSLLQAAVKPHPQLSEYHFVYARPLSDTLHEIRDELCKELPASNPVQPEAQKLSDLIESRLPPGKRLLLVLDQFEELFIRQGAESRQKFILELIELLSLSQREVRCLLSLRSDYLDRLDELELPLGRDPLRHRMRIYNLSAAEARAAITMPAKDFGIAIEPALLDQLLSDLTQSDVAPPQLQIVCYELWQDWRTNQQPERGWTLERYIDLGGTGAMLTGYLDRVIAELDKPETRQKFGLDLEANKAQDAARAILKGMVSAERTKIATSRRELTQNELVNRVDITAGQTRTLLNYLTNQRIIRRLFDSDRYELAHEVMIEKVWQWVSDEEKQLLDLRDLLARATSDYVKFRSLLPLDRLTLLTEQGATLTLGKASSELLLLSAIEHNFDPTIWISKMQAEQVIEILGNMSSTAKYAQLPQIAKALGATDSPKALRYLQELLPHPSDEVQRATLRSLINLRSFGVIPILYRALQREEKLNRIAHLIDALEQIRSNEAITMLFGLASDHPNPHVCSRAANALLRLNQPLDVHFLLMQIENGDVEFQQSALRALNHTIKHDPAIIQAILMNDEDPRLQFVTIRSLVKITNPNTCNLLIAALSAKEIYVRTAAARALGQLGDKTLEPLPALLSDANVDVRTTAAMALGQLGDVRALEVLLVLLKDTNIETRLLSIQALGQVWKLPALFKLGSSRAYERVEAARALGQLGDVRALEPLLALLDDADAGVRTEAARALSQLGDVRALEPLLALLDDADAGVRTEAARALGQLGDVRALEPLLALLNDGNAGVRVEATRALGQLGDKTLEPLLALLSDGNAGVRTTATRALGQLGDVRALEPLLALLSDGNVDVRTTATRALGQLGDVRALEPLLALLSDGNVDVRTTATRALGQLGDVRALEPLLALLSDGNVGVRTIAARALGQLGDVRALEPLLALLDDANAGVRIEAARALGQLGDVRALEPLLVLLSDASAGVRTTAVMALGQLGDKTLESLLALLSDGDVDARITAVMALGQLGDVRALEPLLALLSDGNVGVSTTVARALGQLGDVRALEPLLALLNDGNAGVRITAAMALGQLGDVRALEPLLALLSDASAGVRTAAAMALGQLGDVRVLEPLLALLDDGNVDVRTTAARALGQLGDKTLEPLLALLSDGNVDVRTTVARALGQLGDVRALEPLLALLSDGNVGVRTIAARALGQLGDVRALEPLLALLDDANAGVRIEAARALGQLGDKTLEPLLALLSDGNVGVRTIATRALGQLGDVRALEPLRALLDDTNVGVRIEAARALGQLGDVRVLEPLLVLLSDARTGVRIAAATALGQLGDKRAVEPLLALLSDVSAGVRMAAATALGQLGDKQAVELLSMLLNDVNTAVRSAAIEALGQLDAT